MDARQPVGDRGPDPLEPEYEDDPNVCSVDHVGNGLDRPLCKYAIGVLAGGRRTAPPGS